MAFATPLVMIGINLLFSAALWGLGMLLRRPKHTEGPRVQDRNVQVSSYGLPKPILYGECKTAMELIYADKLREHRHTQSVGKGGGGDTVTTYTYSCTWAGMFGIAPDNAIFGELVLLKLWIDDKLAYNAMADSDKVVAGKAMKKFKFYSGTATQLPDSTLEGKLGNNEVPGYRHKCYGVFNNLGVTPYGNRIPTIRALTAPGAATAGGLNDVAGFEGQVGGIIYNMGMVMHPDGIHLITGMASDFDGTPNADGYIWQLVNTYTRSVVATKKYYPPDPHCAGVGDPACNSNCMPFGAYNNFDIDERGFIYAVSCEERGYVCKLDSQTFTVQAIGPEFAYPTYGYLLGVRISVSKNPLYPYCWLACEADTPPRGILLINRDTLANPFDATNIGHFFPDPINPNSAYTFGLTVNNSDGSAYVLTGGAGLTTVYLSRLYPNGGREDHEIGSQLPVLTNLDMVLTYDSNSNQLIFPYTAGSGYQLAFFDASTYTLNGATSGLNIQVALASIEASLKHGVQDGHLYVTDFSSGHILKIDVLTREVVEEWDDLEGDYLGGLIYVPYKRAIYIEVDDEDHYLQELTVGRVTTGTALLANIVEDICKRVGVADSQLNTAQLTDEVKGYLLSEDQSAREAIEPLMEAFIFDGVEVDGVLTFIKRGGVSVATITDADLAVRRFGESIPEPLEIELQDEVELPRRIEVHYKDQDRKHEAGVQFYGRQVTDSRLIQKISTPVLMDADQAKQLAHVAFRYAWQAKPCSLSLGPEYAKLMPGDVITVSRTEGVYRVLLMEAARDGLMTNWKGILEDFEYISTDTGETGPIPDDDVDFAGPSLYQLMDLPPLLDAHDQAGIYMASGAYFDDWTGCNVWVSKDEGDTFTRLQDLAVRATTGIATTALADFANRCIDHGNSITVRWDFSTDALADKTTAEWLNGQAHYLLIGDEIICAKDVTTNGDGTQTFGPPLIRGAKGTEYAMTGHVAGERVVVLSTTTVVFTTLDSSYLNQSYLYNGLTYGDDWEDGSKKIVTTELRTLKPWAGVQAEGARDGSNNLTITWRRRDRFGHLNPWRAGVEVPMSEASEAYEVDILLSSVVVRTISSLTNESASYTAAQQTADGLTPGDPVDCMIYQISATVGRGWPLEATV